MKLYGMDENRNEFQGTTVDVVLDWKAFVAGKLDSVPQNALYDLLSLANRNDEEQIGTYG